MANAKTPKSLSKKEVDDIINSVAATLAADPLKKADPPDETSSAAPPEDSSSAAPPASDGPPPEASASPGAPGDDGGGPPPAPGGDPAADQQVSPEALQAEYAALPPEELQMHFMAIKGAMMASMGGGAPGAPAPDASASAGPPDAGAPPMDASAGPGAAMKSELQKSQRTIAALQDQVASLSVAVSMIPDLQKSVDQRNTTLQGIEKYEQLLVDTLGTIGDVVDRESVRRKAVTSVSQVQGRPGEIKKSEPGVVDTSKMSRTDVIANLNANASRSPLKKSDRDAVISFVNSPAADPRTVAHLIVA